MGKSEMSKSSLVSIWLLFFLAILFVIFYGVTYVVVTAVMSDFHQQSLTVGATVETLQVEPVPVGAHQTDQYTPIQGAVSPIGKELN